MTLKYSFKLIFVKCIFEFNINTAPQVSNRVYGREKYLNCNYRINFQCQRGQVVWELYSRAGGSESVSSNLCVNNFFFFVHFFSVSFSYFF